MSPLKVGIVMGSDSDWPTMQAAVKLLDEFDVQYEVRVISAHRTPEVAGEFASTAVERGLGVIISAAGVAAHLGGVMAAHTPLPIVGVPMQSGALQGLDALLSTVQMPPGVPVATVAIGGARNAALLAVQILAVGEPALMQKVVQFKAEMAEGVRRKDAKLQEELKKA